MSPQIRPLSYALGAEVVGIDIRKPLNESDFRRIHGVFLEHCVLLFRGQPLTREQHITFSRHFGELDKNELAPRDRDAEHPEILFNTNQPKPGGKALDAAFWHSDRTFSLSPALAALLHGVDLPPVG